MEINTLYINMKSWISQGPHREQHIDKPAATDKVSVAGNGGSYMSGVYMHAIIGQAQEGAVIWIDMWDKESIILSAAVDINI